MDKANFKLPPTHYILVEVTLIKKSKEHGEEVHRELSRAKVHVMDSGTYSYSTVSCGLQSAVCTALDAVVQTTLPEDLG